MLSYITLDVVSQACPLCFNGNSRSSVGSLNVDVVIRAIDQLEKEKKRR